MQFITSPNHKEGTAALAQKIITSLQNGSRVLWLIPGGSNIPIAVDVLNIVRANTTAVLLSHLTFTLTDERFGPVGHPDSNWQQLQVAGVNTEGLKAAIPILVGQPLAETVARFGGIIEELLKSTDIIIGQFGMGADGHIAGILPHTPAVTETLPTSGYEGKPFTRVSLTFPILRKINAAYMFVSNATKKAAIDRLHEDNISLADQPAQILKEIPEVFVYID